ncbi:MAG: hypothetical protein NC419_10170 [Muribaculaceae bacterium]|nr:hypothetical protein [Muribaculaceae bacterium]
MGKRMEKKKTRLIILAIALIFTILFCTTETVMSRNKTEYKDKKKYYAMMEKEYLSGMEKLLDERGYPNSGITIRWIMDETGNRTYTVLIHHRKINALDHAEKEELLHQLAAAEFADPVCSFNYCFLET